ncbi:hypothetical protein HF521_006434 [Silurus meridionalis]|uniref:Uncharacterized protein n=1 Tax=Silurus meridionalis TaxID=175797 RepID=A0A8T0AT80_SILME|nr:hypothetical protein HF521_006434 [Silurus meridionalis]
MGVNGSAEIRHEHAACRSSLTGPSSTTFAAVKPPPLQGMMKGGPGKAMFFHSFPRTEEEEEAGEDEDEALKQEDEEKSVSGDPYVVVKLEDERDGGHEAERSAGSG